MQLLTKKKDTISVMQKQQNIAVIQAPQPSFSLMIKLSWMTPLIQAPSIISQLILSLCTVSIATCNKLFENMMPFYGDTSKPKVTGCTQGKTFLWVPDTGSAVTCMNRHSFETAYGKKPKTATGQNECYKIELWIKGRKCTHIENNEQIK